jgi:protein-disulfide isomerase
MTFDLGASIVTGLVPPPLALAGGWWIFLIFVVAFVFVIAFGYYTVRGSGISLTPYRRSGGPPESPPELAHDITQDVRNWERGTAGHHGRDRPPSIRVPVDPAVAGALGRWRKGSAAAPGLDPPVGPGDHTRGPAGATTVAIYLDVASEPCRSAFGLLTRLAAGRPLRVAVRHLPLADVHLLSLPAAEALEAAGAQGMFFELLDRLVGAPFGNDEETLLTIAAGCVADPERLREEVQAGRYRDTIVQQIDEATASGAHVVPELYIDGEHYAGELKTDALTRALVATGSTSSGD